jgi:hypothetical protein
LSRADSRCHFLEPEARHAGASFTGLD